MNERRTDSSGLPLRAMVMVLLFLGVVFLLVGFQAMGSGSDSDSEESVPTVTTTTTAAPAPAPPTPAAAAAAAKADVRVYNLSSTDGAAENAANQLRGAGWNVTETGNLTLDGVTVNTVYFGDAPGERESADQVGLLLQAPVEPRGPGLTEQPPGVIVAVTS
jgi:hypothetical protein